MAIINLKKYYYPIYTKDTFVEVSDEVAEALLLMQREENALLRRIYYHKAYFSLDRADGIENDSLIGAEPSPEEILLEKENERYYLLTLERLAEALASLTPAQARCVRARYFLGIKARDIADSEGVSESMIYYSTNRAVRLLREYFKKHKWKEFEE